MLPVPRWRCPSSAVAAPCHPVPTRTAPCPHLRTSSPPRPLGHALRRAAFTSARLRCGGCLHFGRRLPSFRQRGGVALRARGRPCGGPPHKPSLAAPCPPFASLLACLPSFTCRSSAWRPRTPRRLVGAERVQTAVRVGTGWHGAATADEGHRQRGTGNTSRASALRLLVRSLSARLPLAARSAGWAWSGATPLQTQNAPQGVNTPRGARQI